MDISTLDIAREFFAAAQAGDLERMGRLLAPGALVSQNGNPPMTRDDLVAFSGAVLRATTDFRYEHPVSTATEDGFVEEHDVCGTLRDGTAFRIRACVVATVQSGLITGMREYLDTGSAEARALLGALGAA